MWADGRETFRDMMTRKFGLACVWLMCYDLSELIRSFSPIIYISSCSYWNFFNFYYLDLIHFNENFINNLLLGLLVLTSRSGVRAALSPTVNRPFMLQVFYDSENLFLWLQLLQIPLVNIPLLSYHGWCSLKNTHNEYLTNLYTFYNNM
jgi:hypothetical protein